MVWFGGMLISTSANASPKEEQFYASFENFCINLLNIPKAVPKMIEAIGGKPVASDKAKMMLQGKEGRVWLLKLEGIRSTLTQTSDNVCTMFGPDVDGSTVENIFKKSSRSLLVGSEKIGSQTFSTYTLVQADPQGGSDIYAIITLTRSNLSSVGGVFLNAIPRGIAEKNGIKIKNWPK